MALQPSDRQLEWMLKKFTPLMKDKLLQHAAGPIEYRHRAPQRFTIYALEQRRMIRKIEEGSRTEATPFGMRAIEMLRDEMMKLEPESPALVPAPAHAEPEAV